MAQKKGSRVSEEPEEVVHVPLQAILLADSFTQKFRPITLERPKVLLPLVNVPMIDYALAWLESAGVEEVFIFCCAHSKLVIDYLEKSEWLHQPTFSVTTIESHNSTSAGDALRLIYERNVIHGDFVLISGDTVSNMSLTQVLKEHKERRKKDMQAIMTMVIKQSKPSPVTHQTRLGNDELLMAIDPETNRLHYYEDKTDHSKCIISLDKSLLAENPAVYLHNDKQDCFIDVCAPEVLSLFTDNFDYQHLRRHFVKGLLVDDIMGYKIFTHEIDSSYAARIDNYRSYDTISKDILQRWTYPFVPAVLFSGNCPLVKLERQGTYRGLDVTQSRSAQIGPFSLIGKGTIIGDNTTITNSVIGEGCTIGCNVSIEGSYIWNNVTIQDDCKLSHAVICDDVVVKAGATLKPGVILSFKVVVGPQFVVPGYSKVSLLPQPTKQDSDEELEYADSSSGVIESQSSTSIADVANGESKPSYSQCCGTSEVGVSGAGYIWSVCEGGLEEEWRHSVAPTPLDKLTEIFPIAVDDLDLTNQDVSLLPASGELIPDSGSVASDDDASEVFKGDYAYFEKEVEATVLRAVHEVPGVDQNNLIIEVNSLRLSYNMQFTDCAASIYYSVIKLALEDPHSTSGELLSNVKKVISKWKDLLKYYLHSVDEEFEVIQKFEEMCLESAREFSPLFALVLHELYDKEIVSEAAILQWESEKEGADESDKIFVKQSEQFIKWLKEAPEESTDEDE